MANACHDRSETSIAEVCFLNLSKADAQYIENKASTEPATAATPRTTSFDANQSGLSPQNEPKPAGTHGSGRPLGVSGPAGARAICPGGILEGSRKGLT